MNMELVVDSDVMVPMRDKVALATDIYYPAVKEKRLEELFPTILGKNIYLTYFYQLS